MSIDLYVGDSRVILREMKAESVHCIITSPPHWKLRDYAMPDQLGQETTPAAFVESLVGVLREAKRVLRNDGTLWLNIGDSYARTGGRQGGGNRERMHLEGNQTRMTKIPPGSGLKEKELVGIPWRVAFALQADGWYLRQDIIWHKPNPIPESVTDRCTKAHEYLFMLSKQQKYYYDAKAIAEPAKYVGTKNQDASGFKDARKFNGKIAEATDKQTGHDRRHGGFNDRWDSAVAKGEVSKTRNKRDVWTIPTRPFKAKHFATFPPALVEPCILAGCPVGGTALDPFGGAGTTALVARQHGRNAILLELNPEYAQISADRLNEAKLLP